MTNGLKKFKKEFPKAAREAEYTSGVNIFYHPKGKSFWLNGEVQLTGYVTGKNGESLTQQDNEEIALNRIKEFKVAKAELEKQSLVNRFTHLLSEARKLTVVYGYFVSNRHAGGDKVTIRGDGDLWITLTGLDYKFQATGKENRKKAIEEVVKQFEAYIGVKNDK